jgi:hypothetical protein
MKVSVPDGNHVGGRLRDRVPVTQCTGYKTPQHTAEDAQWGWEQGFRAYKMDALKIHETGRFELQLSMGLSSPLPASTFVWPIHHVEHFDAADG